MLISEVVYTLFIVVVEYLDPQKILFSVLFQNSVILDHLQFTECKMSAHLNSYGYLKIGLYMRTFRGEVEIYTLPLTKKIYRRANSPIIVCHVQTVILCVRIICAMSFVLSMISLYVF